MKLLGEFEATFEGINSEDLNYEGLTQPWLGEDRTEICDEEKGK